MSHIDVNSSEYPYLLKQIKDPPVKLYYRGSWDSGIFKETLSVVGSRKMTRYGEIITDRLISSIAGAGVTIVSGFMYGIDAQAHNASLEAEGQTIAVMPCGIERIHPEYQVGLYERILGSRGLIVSEYPGDTPPALWTYPRRNRIIAGLSQALLVVEAGIKSGALITAGIAKKYNKKIFAVPGPLTSSVSMGTVHLIKQGASIVTDADDLLLEYGKLPNGDLYSNTSRTGMPGIQKKILQLLSAEPLGIDEITRILKKSTSEVGAALTVLNLKKCLTLHDGRYFFVKGA